MTDKVAKIEKVEYGSTKYFILCAYETLGIFVFDHNEQPNNTGGVLSCGLTHFAMTPVDVVKCNAQADPAKFNKGMLGNMAMWGREQGTRALFRGWAPTLVGYSLQGMGKFGLYEVKLLCKKKNGKNFFFEMRVLFLKLFKYKFAHAVGEENATRHRTLLYSAASASAEFFADILLCPLETVKLKVQTVPGYGRGLADGASRLLREEGTRGAFQILPTLWGRQIPYTVIKFVAFERIIEFIYGWTEENWNRPKSSFNKVEQLGWTFVAGYAAGVICGAVSHPADTMATLLSKSPDSSISIGARIGRIYKGYNGKAGIGFGGLWKGFGPRVFMIGTLTGLQWFIYDSVKTAWGVPTTGGSGKKH
ncbi:mitochondrial phosphate carrier protein [Reticulomyxa filosa]|uniref:Mitochondrial phosphate carrier protein n=1 Tax=Reticulomyxa filosa TaxID=46433 RepID=X6NU95_RETFI|nr:mitochondrial phosphate carrier protein [Reticulomyxa filosa]|eukprot:ETO29591.1 mitochondrial phosphate carrier protein [Reticulomyxa filosa]